MTTSRAVVPLVLAVGAPGAAGPARIALDRELDRWLDPSTPADDLDGLRLARLVTDEVRGVGKHLLAPDLLRRLATLRDGYDGRDPRLDAFLSCVLDKHEGRFWNGTYLFLPVLEVLMAEHDLEPLHLAELLAADIVRHELATAHRGAQAHPLGPPDPRTLRARVRHALRFVTADLDGPASTGLLAALGRAQAGEADLEALSLRLPAPSAEAVRDWLDLTAQPVSTVHDERFFVRVLQTHEMAFTAMSRRLREAVAAVRAERLGRAARLLEEVVTAMDRNASLFRIVATMRPEAFHTFRQLTDGASAIQSEQYKRFEGLCGLPPPSRLASPAFDSVPRVRAEVTGGQDTMTDAYRALCGVARDGRDAAALATIAGLLRALEDSHRRWKATHVTLASRMLGDARGSGHTSGVDYLRRWVDHRLFWRLPEIGVTAGSRRSA